MCVCFSLYLYLSLSVSLLSLCFLVPHPPALSLGLSFAMQIEFASKKLRCINPCELMVRELELGHGKKADMKEGLTAMKELVRGKKEKTVRLAFRRGLFEVLSILFPRSLYVSLSLFMSLSLSFSAYVHCTTQRPSGRVLQGCCRASDLPDRPGLRPQHPGPCLGYINAFLPLSFSLSLSLSLSVSLFVSLSLSSLPFPKSNVFLHLPRWPLLTILVLRFSAGWEPWM
jgi:hypothetical protein